MAHHALEVLEVVETIAQHVSAFQHDKRTLRAMVLTCRLFRDAALPLLWESLPSLAPLVQLARADLAEETRSIASDPVLRTLRIHLVWVKDIEVASVMDSEHRRHPAVDINESLGQVAVATLERYREVHSEPLARRLQCMRLSIHYARLVPECLTWATALLSASLHILEWKGRYLRVEYVQFDEAIRFQSLVPQRAPNLSCLLFDEPRQLDLMLPCLPKLNNLTRLQLRQWPSIAVLRVLSGLHNLKELCLSEPRWSDLLVVPVPLPSVVRFELKNVSAENAINILSSVELSSLEGLRLEGVVSALDNHSSLEAQAIPHILGIAKVIPIRFPYLRTLWMELGGSDSFRPTCILLGSALSGQLRWLQWLQECTIKPANRSTTDLSITWSDEDLDVFAQAWPQLQVLQLYSRPPNYNDEYAARCTTVGLASLAANCPSLRTLAIGLDLRAFQLPREPVPSLSSLSSLELTNDTVLGERGSLRAAHNLASLFPRITLTVRTTARSELHKFCRTFNDSSKTDLSPSVFS